MVLCADPRVYYAALLIADDERALKFQVDLSELEDAESSKKENHYKHDNLRFCGAKMVPIPGRIPHE